ncbi:MAG: HNH endonuclease signature motif containing protein [Desulfosporosinus sp.]
MKSYKTNNGLKSEIGSGILAGLPTKLYPDEVRRFIAEHYIGVSPNAMTELLNKTFSTSYTKEQIKAYYARFKYDSGLRGYFHKGHTPANKGKKGISYPGMKATQFKKGSRPHNWVPIGSERITEDGYIQVKIQEGKFQKNWKGKHILIWEKHHGQPVPTNHNILFGDGNRRNFDPNNLLLVSNAQLARLNQYHLIQNDVNLTRVGIVIADISNKIGELRRKEKKH